LEAFRHYRVGTHHFASVMVMMIWVVRLWIRCPSGGSGSAGAVCFWDSRDRLLFVLRPGNEMLAVVGSP